MTIITEEKPFDGNRMFRFTTKNGPTMVNNYLDLKNNTLPMLKDLAKALELKNYSTLNKKSLISYIETVFPLK